MVSTKQSKEMSIYLLNHKTSTKNSENKEIEKVFAKLKCIVNNNKLIKIYNI
jgi:hypothetical protein